MKKEKTLQEVLAQRNVITDGAFGTYYEEKYHTREMPELANTEHPERVKEIYREYIEAGAGLIRTNTFAANTVTMQKSFAQVERTIAEGIRLAKETVREAAGEKEPVFIAGDIFEAVYDVTQYDFRIMNPKKQKQVEKCFKSQLYTIFKILREYDLSYYAINGNHEYGYEQLGIMNPLKQLEEKLRCEGIDFNSYGTYIVDFLIAGVVKRVMHLESYYERKTVCNAMERLYEFERHGGLNVKISETEKVPIRFLECGHVHLTMELYSARHNVYVMQPGSLIVTENPYESGIFVRGEVTKERNIVRY